jgi:nucleotide-binding universal stress UspA family protein
VALLHAAAELEAGCLVMGAYGHSRLRETVLGGVTRDLIGVATLPLLMAH